MMDAAEIRQAEMQKIADELQVLREVFHQKPFSGPALQMFVKMWWPYDHERLVEAINKLPAGQRFMPTPGELKAHVAHKPPSKIHGRVDRYLGENKPSRLEDRMPWRQDEIDWACEMLDLPVGIVKQGEI